MRYRNAMQRDPNLAKAFDNLAGLFAPPSGADFLASAKMQSERADASRRDWLFNNSSDPTASARSSLQGYQNYSQTPSGFGQADATNRRGQDVKAATDIRQTQLQQEGELARLYATPRMVGKDQTMFVPQQTQAATGFSPTMTGIQERDPGKAYVLPDGTTAMGPAPVLSLDQRKGEVFATLPQEQQQAAAFGNTPVETVIMNGQPKIVARRDAIGQSPAQDSSPDKVDNYLAIGPDGKEQRFLGLIGPGGQILDVRTGQPVPNVVRREGTSGGMSVEVGKDGTFRLVTGNNAGQTNSRTTDLQRAESEGNRAVNELIPLFSNLREDDLGARGITNDLLTNYGAQIVPGVARTDVAGRRNQLRATTLSLAKALLGDDRLSDADRRAAEAVSVSNGIDESLPGAQAKIASLIVLNAYRASYAKSVREGQQLPPLSPQIVGQMVDNKVIPAEIARQYVQNNFNAPPQTGGPVSGVQMPTGAPGAPQAAAPAVQGDPLAEARAAIARGAPRDAVIQRLQGMGVNVEGL